MALRLCTEASAGIEPAIRVLQFSARPSLAFADIRRLEFDGRRTAANDGERLLNGTWPHDVPAPRSEAEPVRQHNVVADEPTNWTSNKGDGVDMSDRLIESCVPTRPRIASAVRQADRSVSRT